MSVSDVNGYKHVSLISSNTGLGMGIGYGQQKTSDQQNVYMLMDYDDCSVEE